MRPLFLLLALVLAPAALAPAALAQSAPPTGDWTGSIEWRNAPPVALSGQLEECLEGYKLTLDSEDGFYRTDQVVDIEGDAVRFDMTNSRRNYTLVCTVEPQDDGTYAGRCSTADGVWARVSLEPPSQATIGCSE